MSPENQNQPVTPPDPKPKRAPRGDIDHTITDDIKLARDCHHQAEKPLYIPLLTEREWLPANQTALGDAIEQSDTLLTQLLRARTSTGKYSDDETAARAALLAALAPVQKAARRTFPEGDPRRADFGVGADASNSDTNDLIRLVTYAADQLKDPAPKAKLTGLTPAEITALSTLTAQYRTADFAAADAQLDASTLLAHLNHHIDTQLNPRRRDLQIAADMAWPHTNPLNAPLRTAFGIPADKATNF